MEITELIQAVEKIPELIEFQKRQGSEIKSLREIVSNLSKDEAMSIEDVSDYTSIKSKITLRSIMHSCGASLMRQRLYVRKSDLVKYLLSNSIMTQEEIDNASSKYFKRIRKDAFIDEKGKYNGKKVQA